VTTEPSGSARGQLTTAKVVFIVVAMAAPLAAVVGTIPLGFVLGNGAGLPAAYLIAAGSLMLFAFGYAAMARRVVNTGAFYTYISHGLGKRVGIVAGLVAVIAYNAQTIGIVGGFGYFTQLGVGIPWWIAALLGVAIVGVLGFRSVNVSASVLAVLMIAEMSLLLLLDISILFHEGLSVFDTGSFQPSTFTPGLANALLLAFSTFVGFESAALFGEETRDPNRSIPLATYISVALIGSLYCVSAWLAVGAGAMQQVQGKSTNDLGELYFDLMTRYVGGWASGLMGVMLLSSLLAAILATHNAASRYMFALGRERLLPRRLGGVHESHLSPHVASLTQTGLTAIVVVCFALARLDPYLNLAASMIALGTLGIVAMQAGAALSVPAFFARKGGGQWFRTFLAPSVAAVVLGIAVLLTATHYDTLTSTSSRVINSLPWLYVVAVVVGIGYGAYLRRRRPQVYSELAQSSPYALDLEAPTLSEER
jgi:amino acid transporter